MKLIDLPLDLVRAVLLEMAIAVGLYGAPRLRMVCKLFNNEIPDIICSSELLELDPKGSRVPPTSSLPEEYLFRLTRNAKKRGRSLPAAINRTVRCLLGTAEDEIIVQSLGNRYTRALCKATAAYGFAQEHNYLGYPPLKDNSETPNLDFEDTSIDVLAAAAFLGCDQFLSDLPWKAFGDNLSGRSSEFFGSPLVLATQQMHLTTVQLLLGRMNNSDQATSDRLAAFEAALYTGSDTFVRVLLDPSHMKEPKRFHEAAVITAIKCGIPDIAKSIIAERGIEMTLPSRNLILETAVLNGHQGQVQEELENGTDPNHIEDENSLLALAAKQGHIEIARLLIKYGADIEAPASNWKPLSEAAQNGDLNMARMLLDAGANIYIDNSDPMWMAACYGHIDMFLLLEQSGADTSQLQGENGYFPLTVVRKG